MKPRPVVVTWVDAHVDHVLHIPKRNVRKVRRL